MCNGVFHRYQGWTVCSRAKAGHHQLSSSLHRGILSDVKSQFDENSVCVQIIVRREGDDYSLFSRFLEITVEIRRFSVELSILRIFSACILYFRETIDSATHFLFGKFTQRHALIQLPCRNWLN